MESGVESIVYAFYKFPWIPQIIYVESMEQSDSISMESTQCFLLMSMDAMEGHGRGGILQNYTEAMELDLVEN